MRNKWLFFFLNPCENSIKSYNCLVNDSLNFLVSSGDLYGPVVTGSILSYAGWIQGVDRKGMVVIWSSLYSSK